ncbi:MAG: 3-oxoacyl-ACP reductase [SAR86 cluster bacterium]|uniref:3-oxoacyl-ACP reductase n=1 Tax=SAR86 cluster bacterium TaxID=2030880 RepID=A0A2A5AW11_9GAMM|nr:MAG: 3-oxoacyl-ACP reductase [SAR86 cluster bacterium]
MEFTDSTVLITGGSRGIGKAIALAFASKGARVAILYRSNQQAADATLAQLSGDQHMALQADVTDAEAVSNAIDKLVAKFGKLDIVVNNAGIGEYHPITSTNYEDWQHVWRQTLDTNLIGPANVCFCAAKHMIDSGGGRIVNITSRGAFRGEPNKPAYGASKAALNSLSQSLAVALAPHKIFVGAVAPGFVNTELTADLLNSPEGDQIKSQSPFNRVAQPEEVAHAVLFLASKGAEFSTGTIIDVNGASYLRS